MSKIRYGYLFSSLFIINAFSIFKILAFSEVDSLVFTPFQTIVTPVQFFTTDKLQQIYIVTPTNEVLKYDPSGNLLFRYNNNTLGQLAYVDATDPFNLILFYPDFMNIISLDRTLSETGRFNLYNLDIGQVEAIGVSSDNNIWLYDDINFTLKKISRQGKVVLESDDLSLLLAQNLRPNFILERENFVFVNDPEVGILLFDLYGQYIKTIAIVNLTAFQIYNNQLLYQTEKGLLSYHLQSFLTHYLKLPNPRKLVKKVQIQKNKLYMQQKENEIQIYTF